MAFRLMIDDGTWRTFDDGDSFEFNDAGLLVVQLADGRTATYSPTAWRMVETDLDEPG